MPGGSRSLTLLSDTKNFPNISQIELSPPPGAAQNNVLISGSTQYLGADSGWNGPGDWF